MVRVPAELFRFATADKSELYVAIMTVFAEANERLETDLSIEAVHAALVRAGPFPEVTSEDVLAALTQLQAWHAVEVTQNPAGGYRSAAEFERRNLIYSLTKQGEAAFAGVQHALAALESSGALQTAVLEAIADRLADLASLAAAAGAMSGATAAATAGAAEDRRAFTAFSELDNHLEALRTNTKVFNGELQRLLRAEEVDLATFMEVKEATVAYLDEFITDLDRRAGNIRAGIRRVEALGLDALLGRALAGADLPTFGGRDPGPAWLARWRHKWEGLAQWFDPRDGSPPRVDQLGTVANRAIISLLGTLDRIYESRRRPSNAVADYRQLARWFATLPTEADCHRLWVGAFGLAAARHAHLAHPDPDVVPASQSWKSAPPVAVSATLRSSGRGERFARTASVRQVGDLRAARREQIRAEQAQAARASATLVTHGFARLSDYGQLDPTAFASLLAMLARALTSSADPDRVHRATSLDGEFRVELIADATARATTATLVTPMGVLAGPDYRVQIVARTSGGHEAAGAGVDGGGRP